MADETTTTFNPKPWDDHPSHFQAMLLNDAIPLQNEVNRIRAQHLILESLAPLPPRKPLTSRQRLLRDARWWWRDNIAWRLAKRPPDWDD